jgi:DNA repair protein RecO (recombination protein O)
MDKTSAILIGRQRLTETSLIVSWCAPELGLFKTVAKGALRPKSSFAGRLDLFVSADIRFVRSKANDLHTLAEAEWTNPRLSLRDSYGRLLAATYLVKLLELMVERETPIPQLYELLSKALDYLTTHDPSQLLLERFELRLAEDLGLGNGEERKPALALQMAIHKTLPVQRKQVLEWIKARAPSTTS